jgi:hypothetical protein
MRPSYLATYLHLRNRRVLDLVDWLDRMVAEHHDRDLVDSLAGAC